MAGLSPGHRRFRDQEERAGIRDVAVAWSINRPVEAVVAQIVAQCRRGIAAAWVHIEGAREILRRSRWIRPLARRRRASNVHRRRAGNAPPPTRAAAA